MPNAEELLRRQKALGKFGDFVLDHDDLQTVLEEGCRLVAEALDTDFAKVLEIDAEGGSALVRAGVGWRPGIVGHERISLTERSSEAHAVAQAEPVITNDIALETRFRFPDFLKDHGVVALVNVPIFLPGRKPWGVLQVDARDPRNFAQEDIDFLKTYAMVLGPVVDRLRKVDGLRASEGKYRTLFDSIDEGFSITELLYDDRGEIVDLVFREVNRAFESQTGVSGVLGRSMFDVVPGFEEHWFEPYKRVAKTGQPQRVENYQADLDRWFDVYFTRIDEDGRFIATVFNDITERKRIEAEARETAERQAFLLSLSDALRTEPDADGIAKRAVRMLADRLALDRCYITAYRVNEDRADILYQTGNDRVPALPDHIRPSDFPAALQVWEERTLVIDDIAAAPGLSATDRRNIGALGMCALISSAVRKGRGNPQWAIVGVSATARRWTPSQIALAEEATERTWAAIERAEAEAALRASEEKYRTLFQSIDEGFCIVEVLPRSEGGAADYRLLEVNQAFERQTGLTNVVGKLGSEVSGGTEDHWADAYEKVARTGEPVRIESHHQGTDHWYDAFMTRVGGPGSRLVCMVFQDTTERREREERQRFLLALGDATRGQSSAEAIVDAAGRMLAERLNPSRVLFAEFDEPNGTVTVFHAWTADGATPFPAVVRQEDFAGPILDDLRAGRMLRVDEAGDPETGRPDLAALAQAGIQAALSVPLIVGGRLVATLSVHQHSPRRWTDGEASLLQEAAERLWADVVRARTEAALRASEQRLMRVLETPAVGLLFFEESGVLIDANDAFLSMSGYSREQVERRELSWQNMTPQDWHEASLQEMENLRKTGRLGPYEKQYLLADGTCRWMMFAARDLGDGTIVEFCFDVTGKRQAEDALRESEQRFRQFGEASSDLVWIRDAQTLAFEYVSPAFGNLYGVPREQVLEGNEVRTWLELIHPEDRERVVAELRALRAGAPRNHEFRVVRPTGETVWVHNTDFPILDSAGRVQRIAGIAQDVTERKRAVELQSMLLAELQHRVRNILALIRSIIRRTNDEERSTEDYVQHLEGRIAALARTQVLLTRKPGAEVDLEELVRNELVAQAASEDQFSIRGPEIDLPAKAAEVLTLAVHELATNATKYGAFSRPDGKLKLEWEISRRDGQDWLALTWVESNVPIVAPVPVRHGFGAELISRRIPYELKGHGRFELRPGGLVSDIEFPLMRRESILQTDGVSR